jgi:hypothetical protein
MDHSRGAGLYPCRNEQADPTFSFHPVSFPMSTPSSPPANPPLPVVAEVRYSLPDLLRELELERASGVFAMEKLDQAEIGKLFKKTPAPRAKSKR